MKQLATLLMTILFAAPAALGQTIGVFADSLGTDCNLAIPFPGGPILAYVVGTVDGAAASGVTASAFRINGVPSAWSATVVASDPAANLVLGDVFTEGIQIAYPGCVLGRRLLLTIEITPSSVAENASLSVLPHVEFGNTCGVEGPCPAACPHFCGCGTLVIPCYCAETVTGSINGPPCVTAIEHRAWGQVKRTYR